jgi:hypothetical protein
MQLHALLLVFAVGCATQGDHCAYCLGGDNEACGCWNGEAFAGDGETCTIALTGDTYVSGTCQTGVCETR